MAEVESNVVGYHTQNWMPASFVMMGGQFQTTQGKAVKLSEIDFGTDFQGPLWGGGVGEFSLTAPQVQIAFAEHEGSTAYYYVADAVDLTPDDEEDDAWGPGWVNGDEEVVDPEIDIGIGFWFKDSFNVTRVFGNAGQVYGPDLWEKDFNKSFRMLVNPYPMATKLSDITFVDIDKDATYWGAGFGEFSLTATQIQIPFADHEGFSSYYYVADAVDLTPDDEEDDAWGPGWVNGDEEVVDPTAIIIPAGRGCWFRPCTNFKAEKMTVIFNK